jgi:hypothetical protein
MEPQRRREGIGREARDFRRCDARKNVLKACRCNRRRIDPGGRNGRLPGNRKILCRTEKNARAVLTAVRPVMFAAVGGLIGAADHGVVMAFVQRGDGRRRAALFRARMCVVPATAQHRVQGQQRCQQIGKKWLHQVNQVILVPTLCVGTPLSRRSASARATRSVAASVFPRRAWEQVN